jgi:hypothetical protein
MLETMLDGLDMSGLVCVLQAYQFWELVPSAKSFGVQTVIDDDMALRRLTIIDLAMCTKSEAEVDRDLPKSPFKSAPLFVRKQ